MNRCNSAILEQPRFTARVSFLECGPSAHEAYLVGPAPSLELVALGQEDAQGEIGQETEHQARPWNRNCQYYRCQPHGVGPPPVAVRDPATDPHEPAVAS